MSGVVKSAKKAFKKVVDVTKKIAKPVMIGAAIYFSAGLALGAFPATAGFAASMPGFAGGGLGGLGIGVGKTAGTGIFSQIATGLGMGSNIQANVLSEVARNSTGELVSKGAGELAGNVAGKAASNAVAKAGASGMQLSDKLLLGAAGTQALSGLLAPSEKSLIKESKKWHGAAGGYDRQGVAAGPEPTNPYARQVAPVQGPQLAGLQQPQQQVPQMQAPQGQKQLLDPNRGRRYVA